MAALIAIVGLLGLSLWVNLGPAAADDRLSALGVAELADLKPDLSGDLRLMEELRRQVGLESAAWRDLSPDGQVLYVTLWAEEVDRTDSWERFAEWDPVGPGTPTCDTVAESYLVLGCGGVAAQVRSLGQQVDHDHPALAAWATQRKAGGSAPRPSTVAIAVAARSAFADLDGVRRQRLTHLFAHAIACGIR